MSTLKNFHTFINKAEEPSSAKTPHFLLFKALKPFVDMRLGDLQTISIQQGTTGWNESDGDFKTATVAVFLLGCDHLA